MAGSIDNPQRRGKHSLTGATRHKGGPILVVGNGPSLNETPLEEFADLPAIGMNKIDLLFSRTTWRPSLIVCVNNLVAQQNRAAFAAIDIPVFLAWKCRWFMGGTTGRHLHYFKNRPTLDFSKDVAQWVAAHGGHPEFDGYPGCGLAGR